MSDPTLDKLSYSVANLAAATDLSMDTINKAVRDGMLVPNFWGKKPIITRTEAIRWLSSLPTEAWSTK